MTAPTVEAAIHELMGLAWNLVYDLLQERGLLGDVAEVGENAANSVERLHQRIRNEPRQQVPNG
jgi:UDP-N-acetylmuramyl pentapeptide synthase